MHPPPDTLPPPGPPPRPPPLAAAALMAALWTLCAPLSVVQSATRSARFDQPIEWGPLFADRFADWYTCALFTPAYFWLARHYPITRRTWLRGGAAHLGATAVFVVIKYGLYAAAAVP